MLYHTHISCNAYTYVTCSSVFSSFYLTACRCNMTLFYHVCIVCEHRVELEISTHIPARGKSKGTSSKVDTQQSS